MSAGELRERFAFDKPETADSGLGVERGSFVQQFICAAGIRAKMGGEEVTAQRLAGRQPFIMKVRSATETRRITTEWRARDTCAGTVYNIRSVAPFDPKSKYIELLVDSGAAADA